MNINNVIPTRRNLARTLGLTAATLCIAVLASCMSNSRAMQNGGEVTGQRSAAYNEPAPFGMVEIKRGYLKAGVENNDTLWGIVTPTREISVDGFWMDQTEVTNSMYRQFVEWVRDSIIRERLADPQYGGDETYKIEVDCANCANKMEEAAKATTGVKDATVNFMTLKMIVEFEEGAEGIIDIIVSVKDKEDYLVPVMLVSCLDEDVELEGEVVQKQIDFLEDVDNITTAGRIILTNGNQMMYADWTGEEYDTEAALPTYEQMEKELFEMEKLAAEHEHSHHGCGCGGHHHEEEHECCGGHGHHEDGHECCGGHNHGDDHNCGCKH